MKKSIPPISQADRLPPKIELSEADQKTIMEYIQNPNVHPHISSALHEFKKLEEDLTTKLQALSKNLERKPPLKQAFIPLNLPQQSTRIEFAQKAINEHSKLYKVMHDAHLDIVNQLQNALAALPPIAKAIIDYPHLLKPLNSTKNTADPSPSRRGPHI